MKIPLQHIDKYLNKKHHFYLLSGESHDLAHQTIDKILSIEDKDKTQELIRFYIENKSFDWDELKLQVTHPSLFNETKYIHIQISMTLDKSAQSALLALLQNAVDCLMIIQTQKLTPQQSRSAWVKWVETHGLHAKAETLNPHDTLRFIESTLSQKGLSTSKAGYQLIAKSVEGNMLALTQTIEKLSLSFDKGHIDETDLKSCLSSQAEYTIYQCVDEAFNQNTTRMLAIFETLESSKTEPTLLLWAMLKELRLLATLHFELERGKSLPMLFQQFHVWESKKRGINLALKSSTLKQCYDLLKHAKQIDEMIKGLSDGHIWHHLKHLFFAVTYPATSN